MKLEKSKMTFPVEERSSAKPQMDFFPLFSPMPFFPPLLQVFNENTGASKAGKVIFHSVYAGKKFSK